MLRKDRRGGCTEWQIRTQLTASFQRGKEQCDSEVPIGPGDGDVLKKKPEMCQQTHSEWTNPHPGSSGKLKVFIQAAIKNKARPALGNVRQATQMVHFCE